MWKRFTAVALLGVLVSGASAQQRATGDSPSRSETKMPQRSATARFGPSGVMGSMLVQTRNRPQPTATARMVSIRFLIAQVTLRGDAQATGSKPTAETRPAKSPILAMPEETFFDVDQLNKELQAAPIDLRSASNRIGARLTGLMKDRAIEIVNRGQLVTLDAQPAFMQLGQREPRVNGVQVTPRGRTNSIVMENVGMIAVFMPYLHDNGRISLEVDLQKSQLGPVEDGPVVAELSDGEKVRTPEVQTLVVQTAVTVAPGQAVALAGMNTRLNARRTELLILVSADLLAPE